MPYTIYSLVDPRDNLIRYVGITDDVYRRFREHVKGEGKNPGKDTWIRDLQMNQEMMIMQSLDKTESYQEALRLEAKWIDQLLAEGYPLFNISQVEAPPVKVHPVARSGKLLLFNGGKIHHTARQIDEILDWHLMHGELPSYVSDRQRYHYRHHPRLEDRRKLLKPATGEAPHD